MQVKDFVRPPFANYDIVVYFGCGLFSLPLLYRYIINPAGLVLPATQIEISVEFASVTISTLVLLFSVYILGHVIAFLASHMIEKTVDLFFGKISTAVILSNKFSSKKFGGAVQRFIMKRTKVAFSGYSWIPSGLRVLALAPVWLALLFLIGFRQVEYFRSRVPPKVFDQVKKDFSSKGYGQVSLNQKWYKTIEHDIINNYPATTARMYNYLVISGIFRSLAFIFLMAAWFELLYWCYFPFGGDAKFEPLWTTTSGGNSILSLLFLNIAFGFCLSAYLKFSRRYVEEAIFGFVLCR